MVCPLCRVCWGGDDVDDDPNYDIDDDTDNDQGDDEVEEIVVTGYKAS